MALKDLLDSLEEKTQSGEWYSQERGNPFHGKDGKFTTAAKLASSGEGSFSKFRSHGGSSNYPKHVAGTGWTKKDKRRGRKGGRLKLKWSLKDCGRAARKKGKNYRCWDKAKLSESGISGLLDHMEYAELLDEAMVFAIGVELEGGTLPEHIVSILNDEDTLAESDESALIEFYRGSLDESE